MSALHEVLSGKWSDGTRPKDLYATRISPAPGSHVADIVAGLGDGRARVRNGCAELASLLSADRPDLLYPQAALFAENLQSKDKVVRWEAVCTLGNLAPVDAGRLLPGQIDRILPFLKDASIVLQVHTLRALVKIARTCPDRLDDVVAAMLAAKRHYPGNRIGHLSEALGALGAASSHREAVRRFLEPLCASDMASVASKARRGLRALAARHTDTRGSGRRRGPERLPRPAPPAAALCANGRCMSDRILPGLPRPSEVDRLLDGWMPPRDLVLGVASAGYQCEGGYNGPGQPQNNWGPFESTGGREVTGAAGRFWDRPEPDLDAAAGMHLNAFRLSVEAARLRPTEHREPRETPPPLDEAAVRGYARILFEARRRGLEPVVTLHHFTEPAWWGPDPWLSERGPDLFVAHAAEACEKVNTALAELGGAPVVRWITINEPNGLALTTQALGVFPRGTAGGGAVARSACQLDGFYSAHVRAHAALHRVHRGHGWPAPLVTVNNYAFDCYGLDRLFVDLMSARSEDVEPEPKALAGWTRHRRHEFETRMARVRREGSRPSALRSGAWLLRPLVDKFLLTPRRLPRLLRALRESPAERPLDALAVDVYEPLLQNHLARPWSAPGHAPWTWHVWPPALYDTVAAYRDAAPRLPLLVAENGMSVQRAADAPQALARADGWRRDAHLRAHLFHLLRALRDGLRVEGLLVWSISDNYEWGSFTPRFGILSVDYTNPERPRGALDAAGVDAAGALRAVAGAIRTGSPDDLRRALLET